MKQHLNITVKGKVIDVNFRTNTKQEADKLGIGGFILNRPPNAVYIEAEGQEETLKQFLAWCHTGPVYAKVESVLAAKGEIKGFSGFAIRYN